MNSVSSETRRIFCFVVILFLRRSFTSAAMKGHSTPQGGLMRGRPIRNRVTVRTRLDFLLISLSVAAHDSLSSGARPGRPRWFA